jgi:hypothetical protein
MAVNVQQVNVAAVLDDIKTAFQNRPLLACSFCGKNETMPAVFRGLCEKMSRRNDLFCRFCLRHDLTDRGNRHTLILTFRSVFAHYYNHSYKSKVRTMYHSELLDMVKMHEQVGLTNPAFKYDPETFLWFVDFRKVGATGRRIPVVEVHKTIINILACFNLYHIPGFNIRLFRDKYREAVDTFYTHRSRPDGRKILNPTFLTCGVIESKEHPFDRAREFLPSDMVP